MNQSKKRLLSFVMVAMLAVSAAALPNTASEPVYTVHAAAGYANPQTEEYARQVAGIVNRERAANGLAPLKYSDKLSEAALVRAEEIQSVFSHTRPNGTRCFTAVTEAGISYRSVGENIAYGQRTPEEVMNSWMNSSGHRANILGSYDYIGVGVTYRNGTYYWSQFFAVSDDLSGEVITLGSTAASSSTTATTAMTVNSTFATTATTAKPTSTAAQTTTKPASMVTTTTTNTNQSASTTTTQNSSKTTTMSAAAKTCSSDGSKACNCTRMDKLKKLLQSLLGVKGE